MLAMLLSIAGVVDSPATGGTKHATISPETKAHLRSVATVRKFFFGFAAPPGSGELACRRFLPHPNGAHPILKRQ